MERRFFPAQVEKSRDGYGIWFADLPGCVSAGKTVGEALEGAHEALALHIAGMAADEEVIPSPSDPELLDGSISVSLVGVVLPGKKKRVNVTIDEGVLAAIDAVTNNRSEFLEKAALKELAA